MKITILSVLFLVTLTGNSQTTYNFNAYTTGVRTPNPAVVGLTEAIWDDPTSGFSFKSNGVVAGATGYMRIAVTQVTAQPGNQWIGMERNSINAGNTASSAAIYRTDGSEFKLNSIAVRTSGGFGLVTLTAARNGVVQGSTTLTTVNATALVTANTSAIAAFVNIDEIRFTWDPAIVGGISVDDIVINTATAIVAAVTTGGVSGNSGITATLAGNVTDAGNATVTERGIVWESTLNPTTANNKVAAAAGGTGSYTVTITSFPQNTTIHYRGYAINSAGTSYGNDATFVTGTLLPVKLVSFTAERRENIVALNWKTDNEIAFSHFGVERSNDGIFFKEVGMISSGGSASSYSYMDKEPANVFYRLRMVDIDGQFSYSPVVSVAPAIFSSMRILPNPASSSLYITIPQSVKGTVVIKITSLSGQVLINKSYTGSSVINLNVTAIPNGRYFVQLINESYTEIKSFVKQ